MAERSTRRWWLLVVAALAGGFGAVLFVLVFAFPEFVTRRVVSENVGGPVLIHSKGPSPKHGMFGFDVASKTTLPLTIKSIVPGSGAASAGLQVGDVILAVGSVKEPDLVALQKFAPGDEVTLTIRRGTSELQVSVRLMSASQMAKLHDQESAPTSPP